MSETCAQTSVHRSSCSAHYCCPIWKDFTWTLQHLISQKPTYKGTQLTVTLQFCSVAVDPPLTKILDVSTQQFLCNIHFYCPVSSPWVYTPYQSFLCHVVHSSSVGSTVEHGTHYSWNENKNVQHCEHLTVIFLMHMHFSTCTSARKETPFILQKTSCCY
jgi:hypothetical protein